MPEGRSWPDPWGGLGDSRWRSRARLVARLLTGSAVLMPLLLWGGEVPGLREASAILAGLALALTAWSLPRRWHLPPLGWIVCAALPVAAVLVLQVWPGSGSHPWAEADLRALGVGGAVRSIDPDATRSALGWIAGLAALAAAAALLWPGDRAWRLAGMIVVAGAVHAGLAIVLAALWPEFPSPNGSPGRVRGTFVSPNQAAACWAMLVPLALALTRWRSRQYAWAAAALAAAVVLSASRGGTAVMLLIGVPLLVVVIPGRRRRWAVPAILALAGLWLWLVNLAPVQTRYVQLEADAATFNGRMLMWRAAVPVAAAAGAFGSGAGTTALAWRRSGEAAFEPLTLTDLHSDPLQLWLELGWAGLALVAAGIIAAVAMAWRRGGGAGGEGGGIRHPLALGGGLGLAHLALHGGAEFLLSSPALAALAVLLGVLLARGLSGSPIVVPVPALRVRWSLVGLAAIVIVGALGLLPLADEARRARELDRLDRLRTAQAEAVDNERRARVRPDEAAPPAQPPHDLGFLTSLREREHPQGHRLATVLARMWLDQAGRAAADQRAGWIDAARAALEVAARACPGSAAAWAERARLAALAPDDPAAAVTALRRMLAWAPGWMRGHHLGLALAAQPPTAPTVGPALGDILLHLTLRAGRPVPWEVLDLAAARSGDATVALLLANAPEGLLAAAAPWLAEHGSEAQWRHARQTAMRRASAAGQPGARVEPTQFAAAMDLLGPDGWVVRLASDREGRNGQAVELLRAGLPVPPALAAAVAADGGGVPGLDVAMPDLAERDGRAALAGMLHEAGTWANGLRQDLEAVEQALVGDAGSAADAPPGVLLRCAEDTRLGAALCERLRAIAQRARRPTWRNLPGGVWAWWLDDGTGPGRVALPPGRFGVVIDGAWQGWATGAARLRTTPGAHRVALLRAP